MKEEMEKENQALYDSLQNPNDSILMLDQERSRYVPIMSAKNKSIRARRSTDMSVQNMTVQSTDGKAPMSQDNYVTLKNAITLDPEEKLLQSEYEKVAIIRRGGPASGIYNKRMLFEKTGKTILPHDQLPPKMRGSFQPGQDSIMLHYDRANMWSA